MRWAGSATQVLFGVLVSVSVSSHTAMAVGLTVRAQTDVGPREYVVQPGDTLWGIAASELGNPYRWPEIATASAAIVQPRGWRLVDPDLIRPGWTLTLPTDRGQRSQASEDSYSPIRLGVSVRVLSGLALNNAGQVAGSDASLGHAFRWDPHTGIQDLGILGDDGWSRAADSNELGQVVGAASKYPEEEIHAFVWDLASGMQDLGAAGADQVNPTVINEQGQVFGISVDNQGRARAFRWDPATGIQDLGSLGGGQGSEVVVADINDKGQVAGADGYGAGQVFVWDPVTGMRDLGFVGLPEVINENGQVVGQLAGGGAFRWDPSTGMRNLGIGGGEDIAGTTVINERGQVAGTTSVVEGDQRVIHAWRWDPSTGMRDLGALGGGQGAMVADINEKGQVVGTSNTAGHYQAWVWDPESGKVDLSAPGDADSMASVINDQGQVAGWSGTIAWEIEDDHTGEQEVGDAVLWTPAGT
jgi:probable HAF family extracellular repeat protein